MSESGRQVAPPAAAKLPSRAQLQQWADEAIAAARAERAAAWDLVVSGGSALSVSVRLGTVESVQFQRDRDLSVTMYYGQRSGSASTSDLSPGGIAEIVRAACDIARASEVDPCAGLPEAEELAREDPALDLYHPWDLQAEAACDIARRCEARGLGLDARLKGSEGAGVDTREGCTLLCNSLGFAGYRRSTSHSIGCSLIAEDAGGKEQGSWYTAARTVDELDAADDVGAEAARRAVARLGACSVAAQRVPVVYEAPVARGLLGQFCAAISGGALYRRASFLLDRIGQPVFAPIVNLRQRPRLPRGPASAAWDSEGVATRDRDLVAGGVLQGYLLGCYAARKLGMRTTGNAGGVFNLLAEPTAGELPSLLSTMGRGLLVTELMGQGVNLTTGNYSRGAAGFWVEDGEIAYPVAGITLAGQLADMFRGIRAIGSDVDRRGGIQTGSILLEGLTIAS